MGEKKSVLKIPFWLILASGFIIFLVGVYGHLLLRRRPELPDLFNREGRSNQPTLIALDGRPVSSPVEIERWLWRKVIGDPVSLTVLTGAGIQTTIETRIIPCYGSSPLSIDLFIGIFTWSLGIVSLFFKKNDRLVRIFFWLCAAFGYSVIVQGDTYVLGTRIFSIVPALGYLILTILGPAFLLHFSRAFPGRARTGRPFWYYVPSALLAAFFSMLLWRAYIRESHDALRLFEDAYGLLRVYMIAYCLAAIVGLARLRLRAPNDDVKAQARWVFFGLAVGMSPFLLLYQLPMVLWGGAILSENVTALCFLFHSVDPGHCRRQASTLRRRCRH